MSPESTKIELLEKLLERASESGRISFKEVVSFVKASRGAITVPEALDFLDANEIVIEGRKKERVGTIKYDDPVWLYLKEMGKMRILDREEELQTAFRMRDALKKLQALVVSNLVSIQKMVSIFRLVRLGKVQIDEFTGVERERDLPEERKTDMYILMKRIEENYKNLGRVIKGLREKPDDARMLKKRAELYRMIGRDVDTLGLSYKILERIRPVYDKILAKYENANKVLEDASAFLNVKRESLLQVQAEYFTNKASLGELSREFGIPQKKLANILKAVRYSVRVLNKLERMSDPEIGLGGVINRIREKDKIVEEYEKAKNALIEGNVRFVINVAKNHIGRGVEFLDLIQEGNHALIKAVERFDPTKGYKLGTYAIWWIRQSMTRAIADQSKIMNLPPHKIKELKTYLNATQALAQKLGREPSLKEISDYLNISVEKIRSTKALAFSRVSLDQTVSEDDDRTISETIVDATFPSPIEIVSQEILRKELRKVLKALTPKEARVLILRYGLDDNYPRTLEEIGQIFHLSRERIRQIEEKALYKLRTRTRAKYLKSYLKYSESE